MKTDLVLFTDDVLRCQIDFGQFLIDDNFEAVAGERLRHRVLAEHVLMRSEIETKVSETLLKLKVNSTESKSCVLKGFVFCMRSIAN